MEQIPQQNEEYKKLFNFISDNFTILSYIGGGAYGCVVKARSTGRKPSYEIDESNLKPQDTQSELKIEKTPFPKEGEIVAIKRVKVPTKCLDLNKKIVREICILTHLNHPNIVKLKWIIAEYNEDESALIVYLVMEYMECDLWKLSRSNHPLNMFEVKFMLYQMLQGIKYIHRKNILHRDIKPGNMLINRDNKHLKICDFGLSRTVSYKEKLDIDRKSTVHSEIKAFQDDIFIKKGEIFSISKVKSVKNSERFDSIGNSKFKEKSSIPSKETINGIHKNSNDINGLGLKTEGKKTLTSSVMSSIFKNFEKKKLLKKEPLSNLTIHVATRWYRAPEIITMNNYGEAVDVWSIACVFAELLELNMADMKVIKPLFPGQACTLSAHHEMSTENKKYQLEVILEKIGTPSSQQIEKIENLAIKEFIKSIPRKERINFLELYPNLDENGLDFFESILRYDPDERPSADSCLNHPFLADFKNGIHKEVEKYNEVLEKVDYSPLHFEFEDDPNPTVMSLLRVINDIMIEFFE